MPLPLEIRKPPAHRHPKAMLSLDVAHPALVQGVAGKQSASTELVPVDVLHAEPCFHIVGHADGEMVDRHAQHPLPPRLTHGHAQHAIKVCHPEVVDARPATKGRAAGAAPARNGAAVHHRRRVAAPLIQATGVRVKEVVTPRKHRHLLPIRTALLPVGLGGEEVPESRNAVLALVVPIKPQHA